MTTSTLSVPATPEQAPAADRSVPPGHLGSALSEAHRADLAMRFHRDGFALLPGVLASVAPRLRDLIDAAFAAHPEEVSTNRYGPFIMARMFELHEEFQALLTAEPFIGLAESILGPDCHLVAQNVVRNQPGQSIDQYHADDCVFLPLPADMPRHDARWRLPCFVFTFQCLLSEVPSDAYGPTQFVPGSHYSGRMPNDPQQPEWEGRRGVSILGQAGDVYLHNGQAWHRGAPNRSDRTRYLLQMAYSQRFVAQRFYPFVNYQLPADVLARADARGRRVLGQHAKGAYG
jgi:ectoine hydroxylase-related dioxygenase (phytanoyl-CoA dioxygenase family)